MLDQLEVDPTELLLETYNQRAKEIKNALRLLIVPHWIATLDGEAINSRLEIIDTAIVSLELLRLSLETDF